MSKKWHDSNDRDEIIEGFARALYACGVMDACSELTGESGNPDIDCYCCDAKGVGVDNPHKDDCQAYKIVCELRPGPGGEWMKMLGETTQHARATAHRIIAKIEAANDTTVEAEYEVNAAKDDHECEPTPKLFGHYLATEWLGHGVSWADSHPDHQLTIGHGEYTIHDIRNHEDAYP